MGMNHSSLPQFIGKLFSILDDPRYANFIRWGPEGKSFIIIDPTEFSNGVLAEHFKHSNMSSFVRQLNKYDFHKVKSDESTRMKYGNSMWEFAHRNFRKDRLDLISLISRKKTSVEKHSHNNQSNHSHESKDYHEEDSSYFSSFQGYTVKSISTITKFFEMISNDINLIKSILLERQGLAETQRLNALVAEDNASCAMYASMILKRANVDVVSVESVNDLTYEYHNTAFDLILISNAIPDVNDILNELRKHDAAVPIILTIETVNNSGDLYSMYPSVTKVLYKPYSHEDLLSIVNKILTNNGNKPPESVLKKCQKRYY